MYKNTGEKKVKFYISNIWLDDNKSRPVISSIPVYIVRKKKKYHPRL